MGKIIGIRVSEDLYKKIKRLKITSKELRKVIMEYVEKRLGESQKTQKIDSRVSEILKKFEKAVEDYIDKLQELCREEARNIAQRENKEKLLDYVYKECTYTLRRHAYNTMRDHYEEKVKPLIPTQYREFADREAYRRIILNAVKKLYPDPYPPVPPI